MGAGDVTDQGEELRHALRLLVRHLLVGYEGRWLWLWIVDS